MSKQKEKQFIRAFKSSSGTDEYLFYLSAHESIGEGAFTVGEVEVEFEVPGRDEVIACHVKALQRVKAKLIAESTKQLEGLDEQINSLLALEAPDET